VVLKKNIWKLDKLGKIIKEYDQHALPKDPK
jgi:hypothetical protein